jgi:hypothetical protein
MLPHRVRRGLVELPFRTVFWGATRTAMQIKATDIRRGMVITI